MFASKTRKQLFLENIMFDTQGYRVTTKRKTHMKKPLFASLEIVLMTLVVALLAYTVPLQAHEVKCENMEGIKLARCERHQKMAEKCGPIKGSAHYECDRDYLIVNALDCKKLTGKDVAQCAAEGKAFKTCEPQPGQEFMRCVRKEIDASPM